jgi:hypothetical protein
MNMHVASPLAGLPIILRYTEESPGGTHTSYPVFRFEERKLRFVLFLEQVLARAASNVRTTAFLRRIQLYTPRWTAEFMGISFVRQAAIVNTLCDGEPRYGCLYEPLHRHDDAEVLRELREHRVSVFRFDSVTGEVLADLSQ